jgi:hypothetical protein
MKARTQLGALGSLILVFALLAFLTYLLVPLEQLAPGQAISPEVAAMPRWQMGLANGAFVLILYSLVGLAGLWFARQLRLPGVARAGAGWRAEFWQPLQIGAVLGIVLIVVDRVFAAIGNGTGFAHPTFPLSIIASTTAAIGEEILFRMFVLGLWAFLLNLILRRWAATGIALGIGNGIAALAFAASHLPAAMILGHVSSPAELPVLVIVEIFLLNGLLGYVAGTRYVRDGLVAAAGIHFWADILWHVIFPLITGVA